jgi:NIPSNAP protein
MIFEVRDYRTAPGRRAEFIELFEQRTGPAQRAAGMTIVGPFVDLENPNRFTWLRGFPDLAERDRLKQSFYESPLWTDELAKLALPMLDSWNFTLTETTPGCRFEIP